jgi:aldehyde dehydrogenase (NAD+)
MKDAQQTLASIAQCRSAFDRGVTRPLAWREAQLRALEAMLECHEKALCEALRADLGKSASESWLTEISYVALASKYTRKHLRRWARERRVHTNLALLPARSSVRPEPLGTVLIIAPWNYPAQLCLAPLVAAIGAGNCAVIKPSELAPATSAAIAALLPEHLDNECFKAVEGGVETATLLLEQRWNHIVFTGGETVARVVMAAAAKHLVPVTLELGGKSPCVVLPDADLDVAARRIAWGRFTNAGQTCVAPDHVMADRATMDELVPRLRREIRRMFGEHPAQSPDFGRIVNQRHFDRLTKLIDPGEVLIGGRSDREQLYIEPTVVGPVTDRSPSMREEIFGPVLPLEEISGLEDAIGRIRARPNPLAAYLFSADRGAADRMIEAVSAGNICINDVMVFLAVDELPFGGVGPSGMGTYKGESGFRRLSHNKTVLRRTTRFDWRQRYAPMTAAKLKWLRRLR